MRGSNAVWVAAGLCAACVGEVEVAEVPSQVEWVGMYALDGRGAVTRSTELRPLLADGAVPFYGGEGEGRFVVGYGGPEFSSAVARVPEDAVTAAPLEPGPTCGPALPTPVWHLGFGPEGLPVPFAPEATPALTASWVEDSCDAMAPEGIAVDVRCAPSPCLARAVVPRACRATLDLEVCGLGTASLVRSPFGGAACFEAPKDWDCSVRQDRLPEAQVALDCILPFEDGARPCDVTVYARSETRPYPLDAVDIARLGLVDAPDVRVPSSLPRFGLISPEDALAGVVWGLASAPSGIWVTRRVGDPRGADCHTPGGRPATELVRVAPDALQVTATATAPPCLQALLPDPGPGAVLGAHPGPGLTWQLSRFDEAGRRLATVDVPSGDPAEWWFAGLVPFVARGEVVAVTSREDPDRIDMTIFALEDLSVRANYSVDFGSTHRVAAGGDETFVAGVLGDRRWFTEFGLDGRGEREVLERPPVRDNIAFMDVRRHAATGRAAFALSRDMTSIHVWDRQGQAGATYYERLTQSARLADWPADPSRMAAVGVGRGEDGTWPALLYLFDPMRASLVPGPVRIGEGVPVEAVADGDGRLWVILAWTGELVRITP